MSIDEQRAESPRKGRIFGGYLLACLTSAVVLGIVFVIPSKIWRLGDVITLTMFMAPVILTMTFLPATLFVWWSEKRAERRFRVYAITGIAIAIVGSVIFFWGVKETTFQRIALISILFIPAGLGAGTTYWLIAGRSAGAGRLSQNSGKPPQKPQRGS